MWVYFLLPKKGGCMFCSHKNKSERRGSKVLLRRDNCRDSSRGSTGSHCQLHDTKVTQAQHASGALFITQADSLLSRAVSAAAVFVAAFCLSVVALIAAPQPSQAVAPGGIPDSNLKFWIKADAGVTQSGPVTGWTDQSSGAQSGTQPTAANQPTFVVDGLNFNPLIDFAGTGSATADANYDFVSFSSTALGLVDHATICTVSAIDTAGEHRFFGREFFFGAEDGWSLSEDTFYEKNKGTSTDVAYDTLNTPAVRCVVVDDTVGAQYLDGISVATDTYNAADFDSFASSLVVGGVDPSGAYSLDGQVA